MKAALFPLTISLCLVVSPIQGQTAQICDMSMTEAECEVAVAASLDLETRASSQQESLARARVAAEVTAKNTSTSDALVPGDTAVSDFNSLVQLAFLSGDLDGEDSADDGDGFAVDLTNFLGLRVNDGYKIQLVGRNAQLFTPIREAIPEADRDRIVAELTKDLGRTDDVSLVFSYSPMGPLPGFEEQTMGRNPAHYRDELGDVFASVRAGLPRPDDRVDGVLETMSEEDLQKVEANLPFSALSGVKGKEFMEAVMADTRDEIQRREALQDALEDVNLLRFADLVANQPQLTVELEQTSRDPLVGPDELKVKGSYEMGKGNVNGLRRECMDPKTEEVNITGACYKEFLGDHSVEAGNRFALSFSYSQVDDFTFSRPENDVDLEIKGDRTITGTLAYGRYLGFGGPGEGKSRLDVNWTYEDVGDDPNRENRHLATAIMSVPMADGTSFQVGLTYSGEPKYLGEVDKELSARLGLTYKLVKPKTDTE